MKYCDNCGEKLPERAKFCGVCGQVQDKFNVTISEENQEDLPIRENTASHLPIVDNSNYEEEIIRFRSKVKEIKHIQCPYCLETIIKGARICRFCRSDLTGDGMMQRKAIGTNMPSSNVARTAVDISFLALQVLIIILAFTDLFTLSVSIEYGGYQIYNKDLFGLGIFSCFDISDFLEAISDSISISDADKIAATLCTLGFALILVAIPMIVSLIVRIVDINSNYRRKGIFRLYEHIVVAPIVYVAVIVLVAIFISNYLGNVGLSMVNCELSPTAIIIIVALIIQIIISYVTNIIDSNRR